jgi:hypothetical protein
VALTVSCDSASRTRIRENYIRVFDGESALSFDGQESFVSVSASPSLNLTAQFTLEAWINPSGWGENPGTGFGRVFDKDALRLFTLRSNPLLGDNTLCLWLFTQNSGSSFSSIPESSIVLNTWQHVAASYEGSTGDVKIYLNGTEQPLTQTTPPAGALNDNFAEELVLGNSSDMVSQYLNGNEAGLVGYWRMNEGNGQFINDFTNNGNHGILGETEWVEGAPMVQTMIYETSVIPANYDFEATIFPNPFNATATISFSLYEETYVEIAVYNILGQEIDILLDEIKSAGRHDIIWQASNTPSGGVAESGKMLLLK